MRISNGNTPSINFGKTFNVHILDGGGHAESMKHFAKATFARIPADITIKMHDIKINREKYGYKYMRDLYENLRNLNVNKGDYVSIPAVVTASVAHLEKITNRVLNTQLNLMPENLKENKPTLLKVLENFYKKPMSYSHEIKDLDPMQQNLECTFGVIEEINKLVKKGVKVFVPSHPNDMEYKGYAESIGEKDSLYAFIATQKDPKGKVKKIVDYFKNTNWSKTNLLCLSDANILKAVGKDNNDYLFSSRENLVTENARGVFNFCPVRTKWGEIKGFSFYDNKTVEYDIKEYGGLNSIKNILKFVGIDLQYVLADDEEHQIFKKLITKGKSLENAKDKLYCIKDVYNPTEIEAKKLTTLGPLINKNGDVFDINLQGEVVFQKCNCEGSNRPSVNAMWGPCFSTFVAIANDIKENIKKTNKEQEL